MCLCGDCWRKDCEKLCEGNKIQRNNYVLKPQSLIHKDSIKKKKIKKIKKKKRKKKTKEKKNHPPPPFNLSQERKSHIENLALPQKYQDHNKKSNKDHLQRDPQ